MSQENLLDQVTLSGRKWSDERPLTDSDLALYKEYGLLRLRNFTPTDLIQQFQDEVSQLIQLVLKELGLRSSDSTISGFDQGLDLLVKKDRARTGRLYMAVRKLRSVYALVTARRVWSLVSQLMGTTLAGIYPNGTGIRMDHPQEEKYLSPWHQEYPYNLTSDNSVTLWVPFQDVNDENGCLLIAPKSHQLGALPVEVSDPLNKGRNVNETMEIHNLKEILDKQQVVSGIAKAGDALAFHTYLMHRSQPNQSNRTRWSLQARYFDFLNPTAILHDWVGGMNEGNDLKKYHPELVKGVERSGLVPKEPVP